MNKPWNNQPIKEVDQIEMWTDGSGTTGAPAGWGFCVVKDGRLLECHQGRLDNATNNIAELEAVIQALELARTRYPEHVVKIYCDSMYVVGAFVNGWIAGWRRRGWRKADGKRISNKKYWVRLAELVDLLDTEWYHVKGHNGHEFNEMADQLAKEARTNV